jgi:hypothetical protein
MMFVQETTRNQIQIEPLHHGRDRAGFAGNTWSLVPVQGALYHLHSLAVEAGLQDYRQQIQPGATRTGTLQLQRRPNGAASGFAEARLW